MAKIAIITDTNSGMPREEADKLGVFLLPMPIIVDNKEYFEGVSCTYDQFFEMLAGGADVSTSQPSPESLTSLWDEVLKEYDAIVHIPMSSGLSSSCATAKALAMDYDGRVCVADNKRISVSQYQSVVDAVLWSREGLSAAEICAKSGRVTAAGAAIASILGIKPVLQIQGEKLDAFAKVRGMANAKKTMLEAAEKDLKGRFAGRPVRVWVAYSGEEAPAAEWTDEVRRYFDDPTVCMYKLPLSISCHVGAGVLAIGVIEYAGERKAIPYEI